MLTIQRNYWADLKSAKESGVDLPTGKNPTKVGLYRLIADHLNIDDVDTLELDQLWAAIDDRNMELACVGVAEHMVEAESTVLDKMAANIDRREFKRPVLKRDRKPAPKPRLRNAKPVVKVLPSASVMAKALKEKGLIIVR